MTDPDEFLRALGKRIRILRLTAELTQNDLAARTDMAARSCRSSSTAVTGSTLYDSYESRRHLTYNFPELIASVEP